MSDSNFRYHAKRGEESPSGKAADFGSAIRRFESCLLSTAGRTFIVRPASFLLREKGWRSGRRQDCFAFFEGRERFELFGFFGFLRFNLIS